LRLYRIRKRIEERLSPGERFQWEFQMKVI